MKSFLKKISQYSKKNNRIKAKKTFVTNYSTLQLFNYYTIILVFVISIILPAHAFEDYIIATNGKLSGISIEDNTIIDVYPLITIMNNKNTLIVSPLKIGKTRFCVLKNNKEKFVFNVEVSQNKTTIDEVKGFEILSIDKPQNEEDLILDEPPLLKGGLDG